MDEALLSKKDLLEITGISYGQLYRWKRMGLIPEEWFLRRPAFTGQETFFPRDKILARVAKILELKDSESLQSLADAFSPAAEHVRLTPAQAVEKGVAPADVLAVYTEFRGGLPEGQTLGFEALVFLRLLVRLLPEVGKEDARTVDALFHARYASFGGAPCELVVLRRLGVCVPFLARAPFEAAFADDTRVAARADLGTISREIKLLLL